MSDVVSQAGSQRQAARRTDAIASCRAPACKLKDNDCVAEQIEKLVAHYPKPKYWQDLTNSLMRVSKNDKELLNILRLADGVGAMSEAREYIEMAQLAMGQGLPGEAQAMLERGMQKGAFTEARDKDHADPPAGRCQDRRDARQVHARQSRTPRRAPSPPATPT